MSLVILTKNYYGDLPHGFLAAEEGSVFYGFVSRWSSPPGGVSIIPTVAGAYKVASERNGNAGHCFGQSFSNRMRMTA